MPIHEFRPNPNCAKHEPPTPHCIVCGNTLEHHNEEQEVEREIRQRLEEDSND